MTDHIARCAALRGIGAVGIGAGALALFPAMAAAAPLAEVMVLSKTAGIRHDPTPAGIATIRQLGTTDSANTSRSLTQFQAVVWRSTAGDLNDGDGHVAADTEYDWAWHGSLVGAYFASNPARQQATLLVDERTNDPTALPPPTNPCGAVNVLMRLDESTYSDGTKSADQPITWWHDVGAGQAWYSGLDHATRSCSDTLFTRMSLGGIRVVARVVPSTPDDVDVSRSRPVTVSSVEPGTSYLGFNAVDGNANTRWSSAFSDPQWISVDLGGIRQLNRVRLTWGGAYGRAYRIDTSTDDVNWQTVYATSSGDGGTDDIAVTTRARYVRLTGTQRATPWGYSLWELSVLGR